MSEDAQMQLEGFLNSYQLLEAALATSDRLGEQVDEMRKDLQARNILPEGGDSEGLYNLASEMTTASLR